MFYKVLFNDDLMKKYYKIFPELADEEIDYLEYCNSGLLEYWEIEEVIAEKKINEWLKIAVDNKAKIETVIPTKIIKHFDDYIADYNKKIREGYLS